MKRPPFHKSLFHALEGILSLIKYERNFRIEFLAFLLNLFLIIVLKLSAVDSMFILGVCLLVLISEMLNSAIEKICDFIQPEKDSRIKQIKDISAGAVLLSVILSGITGILVYPKYVVSFL